MRTRGLLVSVSSVLSLGGCTLLFIGDLDDAKDGTGTGTAPLDAGADRAAADAIAIPETGAIDARPAPFCDQHRDAMFCDDFDAPNASLATTWPSEELENGATVALSSERAASPPTSALVVSKPIAGGNQPIGCRIRDVDWPDARTTLSMSMSIFVDETPLQTSAKGYFAALQLETPPNNYIATRLVLEPGAGGTTSFYLQWVLYPPGNTTGEFSRIPIGVPTRTWTRIERVLRLGASPTETLTVDGTSPVVLPLDPAFTYSGSARLTLGFQYTTGPGDGFRVYVDDVVFDAR